MTKADGAPKINGVEVGELSFTVIGPPTPVFAVKYALLNADSGDRFGYGHRNTGWSDKTMEALAALVASVEADVCLDLFEGGTTSRSVLAPSETTTDGIQSL